MKIALTAASARHPAARPGAAAAIAALNLQVAAGERLAIIGPSGAGKTTLLQLLACALPPTAGVLQLDGQSPWHLPRADLQRLRGRLFLAPQVPPLPPRQRVVTSVLAGRLPAMGTWQSLRSLFYPVDIPAAYEALDRFDLADKLFERVDRLSGGERQRVGLARAIVAMGPANDGRSAGPPQARPAPLGGSAARAAASAGATLLLIDEPLSALDPTRARQAMDTLLNAARERGATLVTTLHQVDVALAHFPRIVGLRDGALAFDLPAAEVTRERLAALYAQHEHELTGPAPVVEDNPPSTPQPVVMHCR